MYLFCSFCKIISMIIWLVVDRRSHFQWFKNQKIVQETSLKDLVLITFWKLFSINIKKYAISSTLQSWSKQYKVILFYDFYGWTLIDQSLYFNRSATLLPKGMIYTVWNIHLQSNVIKLNDILKWYQNFNQFLSLKNKSTLYSLKDWSVVKGHY